MGETTKIEWCDKTFNPWEGCTNVGPGCDHCYAETRNNRFHGGNWGPGAPRRRTSEANWRKPIKWNNTRFFECPKCGWRGGEPEMNVGPAQELECPTCNNFQLQKVRPRVFCASLADIFDNEVDPEWRWDLFKLIISTPHLDWLLLTKRIGNVPGMLDDMGLELPENVSLGATIVNQEEADRDIPKLLAIPAAVRFLSMEPLLGAVNISWYLATRYYQFDVPETPPLDWVIVGGESGPGARPMQADWARSLRDQCKAAGVPFFMKQMGGPVKRSMPMIPPDLMIREFPS